ncbi:MAG: cadherin domain-containing protein, partial [Acidobacteriota bacterium]|nr:cadherin domain-containing protein [Acidobacteriota bacterium]
MAAFSQRRANLLALLLGLSVFLGSASAVNAQRLFRIVESEAAASAPVGSGTEPRNAAPALELPVDVDLDLLRSGPERLEMLTPERHVIVVERTVFEDRAGGNVMFSGRAAGAGFDTVVLTLHDGVLVGVYGTPGNRSFNLVARDTRGRIGRDPTESKAICREPLSSFDSSVASQNPTASDASDGSDGSQAAPGNDQAGAPPPVSLRTMQQTMQLDVLVLYTSAAATDYNNDSSTAAEIQALVDYSNLVMRNNQLGATMNLVAAVAMPGSVSTTTLLDRNLEYYNALPQSMNGNSDVLRLRAEHQADVVAALHYDSRSEYCGEALAIPGSGSTAESMSAVALNWSNTECSRSYIRTTFIHEVGHSLGANHDPDHTSRAPSAAIYPYAFGHTDLFPSPPVETIMSYGVSNSVRVPWFSTSRLVPPDENWLLGIPSERDNERALQQTLTLGVRMSDYLPPDGAPTGLTGTASVDGNAASVALQWNDNSSNETGFIVEYRTWNSDTWTTAATLAAGVTATTLTGLRQATRYVFRVMATRGSLANSDAAEWDVRTPGDGPPTGPAGSLKLTATGFTSILAEWSDNSISETGYAVELKTGSSAYGTAAELPANTTSFSITNLAAGTGYTVRVGAVNRHGTAWSAEQSTSTMAYPAPAAPASLEGARLSETSVRLTWRDEATDELGYEVQYRTHGTTPWTTWRTLPAESDSATLTGLAARGKFDFRVVALGRGPPGHSSVVTVDLAFSPPGAELSGRVVRVGRQAQAELTWTVTGTADSVDVTYRRSGESRWTLSETVAGDVLTANFVANGSVFELRLKVYGAGGRGFSNTIEIDLSKAPPVAPSAIILRRDDLAGASVRWTDNSATETGFEVEFGRGTERTTWGIYPANSGTSPVWLKGLGPGTWTIHVSSRNEYGSSHGGSSTIDLTDPFPVQPPTDVAAEPVDATSARASWSDTDGESGYIVSYRRDDGAWQEISVPANRYFHEVRNLTRDAVYRFRIVAWTSDGYAGSSIASVDLSRRRPRAPLELKAVATNATTAKLTWTDGSANETAFDVRYREGNRWSRFGLAPENAESARVTGLTPGRRYRFEVQARNSHGAAASNTVNLRMPQGDLLPAPSNVSVTVLGGTSAAISWQDDTQENKFQLEHRTGEALWTRVTLAADTTTHTLVDLRQKTAYEVRVGAKNSKGTAYGDPVRFTLSGPPVFPQGGVTIRIPEGTTGAIGSPVVATPSTRGGTVTYSLSGQDAAYFRISAAGQLSIAPDTTLNHEQKASYAFNVVASDGATPPLTATRAVTVTVTDVDESLTISGLASGTVAENAAYASATPTVSGHRGTVTWTKEGADAANFTIASATGALSMVARDHESPADANKDNAYEVTVKATDQDGIEGTASITVTVTNVNEAPAFSTAAALATSVPEGTTGNIGSPVTATDPEGAALTYSLTGTDAAAFQVSAAGQISLATGTTLNHEQKASYSFNVVVSDGATPPLTATRAVTVTVTDVDETLTIAGLASGTVAENAAYTSATPTVSGHRGTVTWTKEGADAADFTIASSTGVLSMIARDHESPADANKDNVYEVTVKATDQDGIEGTASITVTVTNVNEAPAFATATALAIGVPEGTTGDIGSPVTATDPEGASLTYSLTGTDASAFRVSAAGQISLATGTVLNHEQKSSYSFNVVVSDGATQPLTATRAVTVTVTDVDETLTISGLASGTVAENAAYTSATPTVSGHRGTVTWTKEGADAADFTIASATGVLKMIARDHEDAQDANTDNVYEVTVKATDQDGITGTASITVTVTNVNEAPSFASAGTLSISVAEGTTGNIGSPVTATDPEGASLTYSLTGTDASAFRVSAAGQISLATGTVLNHERKASYSFNVVASDGATQPLTATRAVTLTVTDVDESLTISGLASGTVAENAAYTSATPTVSGHQGTVTWTKEGADAADFTIASATGVLSMIGRDHEDPQDANKDNAYEVTVKATDQDGIEGTASITVTVTNVNEAPAFATATALAIGVPEGTTGDIGSPVTATDPEGAQLAYSLTGTDAAAFQVSAAGQISLATGTVLNHERKASYSFNVVASDGATQPLTATRAVTLTVTDVDESLTISGLASGTVAENAAYTSATPTVSGHQGTVTWTKEGADAADFTIASATGVLSMIGRDHEDPQDANKDNAYEVTVKATDQDGIEGTASITVTVTNVNEAPAFATATALAIGVPEGTTGDIGSPVTATDPEGAQLAYSLTGTDAAAFQVSAAGQISLATGTVLNHERKASYSFNVVASDGATQPLTATRAVTLTVTDVDESLTISGLASGTVAENAAYTSATPTVSGHRGTVTWTKEGADAADFTIASGTGVLKMVARDHEDAQDANTDNAYEVTVKATDADGITGTASITVTVTNVNEAPSFASAGTLSISVAEGTTGNIGSPVTATDPEGASLTYSLTGTDASAFRVSAAGQISLATGTVLNHERKTSYSFNVVVSDGATQPLTATRAVTLTVTDVDESLTISGLASGTVAENAAYTSATPTVSGHRGTVTWTKEGADAADFTIASATGALSMVARDHEDAQDANKDNAYEVTVKATDADGITGTASITVTVTNVNEAPAFSTAAALAISVPEGTTGDIGSPVTATDPEGAALTYSLTGADASAFQVSAAGQISLATGTVLNHEQKSSYSFNVVVSDGATPPLTATRAVTLTVTDVDESLTISGLAGGTVAENVAYTSATPTVSGHRGTVTWTKEGADAADFTIASATGALSMVARDHESPQDANKDNVYEVTVKATDQDGIEGTASITVTVTNVNEAPSFASAGTLAISVPEGTTGNIGSPVTATDPEGATLAYSLTGTDASAFQVSAAGQISLATGTTLNHEQKSSYSFNVVVSDGA